MKKLVVLLLILTGFVVACKKYPRQPLVYTVSNDAADSTIENIFIPNVGTYTMPVLVKFLSGYQNDSVTLVVSGLPAGVTVSPDTVSGIPNYNVNFVFTATNAAIGTTPVTITAYATTGAPRVYYFTLTAIPPDCASLFLGPLTGNNACSANYTYAATGVSSGTNGTVLINNFGGYGTHTNASVILNCESNTLSIPSQNIGNGTVLQGSGTYTATSMTINYSAVTTPGGIPDNCVATFTK